MSNTLHINTPQAEEAVEMFNAGHSVTEIARTIGVHKSTVSRWIFSARTLGMVEPIRPPVEMKKEIVARLDDIEQKLDRLLMLWEDA